MQSGQLLTFGNHDHGSPWARKFGRLRLYAGRDSYAVFAQQLGTTQ